MAATNVRRRGVGNTGSTALGNWHPQGEPEFFFKKAEA